MNLPSEEIQLMFTGLSGEKTMQQAQAFHDTILKEKPNLDTVLDFGCGWGRITRCFLRETKELYGSDCLPYAIQLCRDALPNCRFYHTDPLPPSPFEEKQFDLIYGYSVFSHLSEEAHLAWLAEFCRILKPGGILALTTRQREFIPRMHYMNVEPLDIRIAAEEYDNGKFIYSPLIEDGAFYGFYGEAAIPEAYVRRIWTRWFSIEKFLSNVTHVDQNIIICKKKSKNDRWSNFITRVKVHGQSVSKILSGLDKQ